MAVKKTMAIVGAAEKQGIEITRKLATGNYRLLLLSNNAGQLIQLAEYVKKEYPNGPEMEVIDCLKDGCWEADIIILAHGYEQQKELTERIKEVATQKIVAAFIDNMNEPSFITGELQQLLPYSKIVEILTGTNKTDIFVSGDTIEAVEEMATILRLAGYLPKIKGSAV